MLRLRTRIQNLLSSYTHGGNTVFARPLAITLCVVVLCTIAVGGATAIDTNSRVGDVAQATALDECRAEVDDYGISPVGSSSEITSDTTANAGDEFEAWVAVSPAGGSCSPREDLTADVEYGIYEGDNYLSGGGVCSRELLAENWNGDNPTVRCEGTFTVPPRGDLPDNELRITFFGMTYGFLDVTPSLDITVEQQGTPDLTVDRVDIDPANPSPGDAVDITADISNNGDGPAYGFNVQARVDQGSSLDILSATDLQLGAGESGSVTVPNWEAVEGTNDLTVEIDEGESITESDEYNNEHSETITVGESNDPPSAAIDCDPRSVTVGETVDCDAYGSTDDEDITAYDWQFGDGWQFAGSSQSHSYDDPGSYTVEVTATDSGGLTDTATTTIDVSDVDDEPSAAIDCSPTSATVGERINCDAFDATDDTGISTYRWDFGNGNAASGDAGSFVYDSPGTYTVELTVTDTAGQTDTAMRTIDVSEINEPPSASIDCDSESVTVGESIDCDAYGTTDDGDGSLEYVWTFGDGADWSGAYATHTYDEPGSYTVELTVTDPAGLTDTTETTIDVRTASDPPTAAIDCAQSTIERGDSLRCDAYGTTDDDGIAEYDWSFGDGGDESGTATSHSYDESGRYTVEVTVTDTTGLTASASTTVEVVAGDTESPTAAIDCAQDSVAVGEPVRCDAFDASDNERISSYDWSLGDGAGASGTDDSHIYDSPGTYTIELTVTDTAGLTDTASTTIEVVSDDTEPPTAAIDCQQASVTVGESISCSASEAIDNEEIQRYDWAFGDDTDGSGVAGSHSYETPGNYTVEVTVTDTAGLTDTASTVVEVRPTDAQPTAAIDCTPASITEDQQVSCDAYESSDDDSIDRYDWQFGDGSRKRNAATTHRYNDPGEYTVELTVVDSAGQTDTASTTVTVAAETNPLEPAIESQPTTPVSGDSVRFDASGSTADGTEIGRYEWDFDGDGETDATGEQTVHTFDEGTHSVSLTVRGTDGHEASTQQIVEVDPERVNVLITSPETQLNVDEQATIEYSVNNFLNNGELTVQLLVETPNDVAVSQVTGATAGSNQFTAVATLPPAGQENIRINFDVNSPGTYTVTAIADYYFGNESSESERVTENITLTVDDGRTDTPTTERQTTEQRTTVGGDGPGFGVGSALVGSLGAGYLLRRRRR